MHQLQDGSESIIDGLVYCKYHADAPVHCPGVSGRCPAAGLPCSCGAFFTFGGQISTSNDHLWPYLPVMRAPTPRNLFPAQQVDFGDGHKENRFVNYVDDVRSHCLIYTSAFHDVFGQRTGFAYEYRGTYTDPIPIHERLETNGPNGVWHPQSLDRGHVRAILAALTHKAWEVESWKGIVIATNTPILPTQSEFDQWINNGWRVAANGDLWEAICQEIRRLGARGVAVSFWKVSDQMCQFVQEAAALGAALKAPWYHGNFDFREPKLNI